MRNIIGYSALAMAGLMVTAAVFPASAAGLLGGVVGGAGSHSLVTVTNGPASDSGTVNVGLGGGSDDSNNVVSANVGETSTGSLASASVTSGGSSGLLTADIDLLNSLGTVDVGIGGNGGPGAPGVPGGPGGNGAAGGGGTMYGYGYFGGAGAGCKQDTRGITRLLQTQYRAGDASQWHRAAGVHIVKLPMCPLVRKTVAHATAGSPNIGMMQAMTAADPVISASLGRARTNSGHVLGVQQASGNLTVYVF